MSDIQFTTETWSRYLSDTELPDQESQLAIAKSLWEISAQDPEASKTYLKIIEGISADQSQWPAIKTWAEPLGIKSAEDFLRLAEGEIAASEDQDYYTGVAQKQYEAFKEAALLSPGHSLMFAGATLLQGRLINELEDMVVNIKERLVRLEARHTDTSEIRSRLGRISAQLMDGAIKKNFGHLLDLKDTLVTLTTRLTKLERLVREASSVSDLANSLWGLSKPKKMPAPAPKGPRVGPPHGGGSRLKPALPPAPVTRLGIHYSVGMVIPDLVNHENPLLGISLRPHQWETLWHVEADWANQQLLGIPMTGVVLKPTGTGKTHDIFAAIILGLKQKRIDLARGDKVLVLVDQKDLRGDNAEKLQRLFSSYVADADGVAGGIQVSQIGGTEHPVGDANNYAGHVIVAMVPTVGTSEGNNKFMHQLKQALGTNGPVPGGQVPLLVLDEYDKSLTAPTWARTRQSLQALAANKLYELGFTATLPQEFRPSTNILHEVRFLDAMKKGIIPPVTLVEIRSNTSLDQIRFAKKDGGSSFNEDDLSITVRNHDRDVQAWMAEEAHALRRGNHIAPAIYRTASRLHALELMRSRQIYYSTELGAEVAPRSGTKSVYRLTRPDSFVDETGQPKPSLGVRNLACLADPSLDELDTTLTALEKRRFVSLTRYVFRGDEYAEKGEERYVVGGVTPKAELDGISVFLSGDATEKVRKRVFEAAGQGLIESVFIVGIWKRGKDLGALQNGIDLSASLSETQDAQFTGRITRYAEGEIDADGTVLKVVERRLIDLVDLWSDAGGSKPALQTTARVIQIAKPKLGAIVDLVSGRMGWEGFGKLGYTIDAEGRVIKDAEALVELPPAKVPLFDERGNIYWLYESAQLRGPQALLARDLRKILAGTLYKNKLSEMAFDLGLPEIQLVGLLNAMTDLDKRTLQRAATFLYQARDRLAMVHDEALRTLDGYFPAGHPLITDEDRAAYFRSATVPLAVTAINFSGKAIYAPVSEETAGAEGEPARAYIRAIHFPRLLIQAIRHSYRLDLEQLAMDSGVSLKNIFFCLLGILPSDRIVRLLGGVLSLPEALLHTDDVSDLLHRALGADRYAIRTFFGHEPYWAKFPATDAEWLAPILRSPTAEFLNEEHNVIRDYGQGVWDGLMDLRRGGREARRRGVQSTVDHWQNKVAPLGQGRSEPEQPVFAKEMSDAIEEVISTLTPREAEVLSRKFGIREYHEHTLEETAQFFFVTRDRIRQIEAKALRKLRHPSRSKRLEKILDGYKKPFFSSNSLPEELVRWNARVVTYDTHMSHFTVLANLLQSLSPEVGAIDPRIFVLNGEEIWDLHASKYPRYKNYLLYFLSSQLEKITTLIHFFDFVKHVLKQGNPIQKQEARANLAQVIEEGYVSDEVIIRMNQLMRQFRAKPDAKGRASSPFSSSSGAAPKNTRLDELATITRAPNRTKVSSAKLPANDGLNILAPQPVLTAPLPNIKPTITTLASAQIQPTAQSLGKIASPTHRGAARFHPHATVSRLGMAARSSTFRFIK